jgi:hypothetical protein
MAGARYSECADSLIQGAKSMTAHRAVPPVALIVLWPNSVAEGPIVQQLVRRLSERRLSATWAVEEPTQVASLRSANHKGQPIDLALLIADASGLIEAIDRGLMRFRAAGEEITAVYVGAELPRGSAERRLRQAGVRAVVGRTIRGEASTVRALPFGLWEFGPHMSAPAPRRWLGLFGRATNDISNLDGTSPAVASIDLTRAASTDSRNWRTIEQLVDQAAEASTRGTARIETIARIAAELSETIAASPQRSILRMAA